MAHPINSVLRLARVLLAAWLFVTPSALANHGHEGGNGSGFTRGEASIGPDQAASLVRAQTGGRVLGVRAMRRGDRMFYRVKVLKSGYVRVYRVDARSGSISE